MNACGQLLLLVFCNLLCIEWTLCQQTEPGHSFLIHLYDNFLEVNVELDVIETGQKSMYSLIVTDRDAVHKYKYKSKEFLLEKIRDAIYDEVDESFARYQLKLKFNGKMEFTIYILDGVDAVQSTKFMLYLLKNPSVSQDTKLMDHLERQIYSLKRKNKALKSMAVPRFGIIMWYKCDDVPSGYVLCDGNNETPDLRNMFVVNTDDVVDDDAMDLCNENDTESSCNIDSQTNDVDSIYFDLCYIMKR